jgi:hypothetical protein
MICLEATGALRTRSSRSRIVAASLKQGITTEKQGRSVLGAMAGSAQHRIEPYSSTGARNTTHFCAL